VRTKIRSGMCVQDWETEEEGQTGTQESVRGLEKGRARKIGGKSLVESLEE